MAQTLEGDLCYANLSLKQPRTSPGSSWKKGSSMSSSGKDHQEEVEYVTMVRLSWGCGEPAAASPPWKVNSTPTWTQLMRVGVRAERAASEVSPHHTLGREESGCASGSGSRRKCFSWGRGGGSIVLWLKVIWGSYQNGRPDLPPLRFLSYWVATVPLQTL